MLFIFIFWYEGKSLERDQPSKYSLSISFSFQLWLEHLLILSIHFHQFPPFNLFQRKPQVCKTKSRQTENVVKKSNGSEKIYKRTEFPALSIFSQSLGFHYLEHHVAEKLNFNLMKVFTWWFFECCQIRWILMGSFF